MKKNLIASKFSDADQAKVTSCLTEAKAHLPLHENITEGDKKGKQNMGNNSVSYVSKCVDTAKSNPEILTVGFNVAAFSERFDHINKLNSLRLLIQTLHENLDNTITIEGQDAMKEANEVYTLVKNAAKKDAKYKVLAQELGEFYKKTKKNGKSKPLAS